MIPLRIQNPIPINLFFFFKKKKREKKNFCFKIHNTEVTLFFRKTPLTKLRLCFHNGGSKKTKLLSSISPNGQIIGKFGGKSMHLPMKKKVL